MADFEIKIREITMADFEKIKPQRVLIDVIYFGCDDDKMRKTIYQYYYDKGYRDIGNVNMPFSCALYKFVKVLKPNLFERIKQWLILK